VSIYAYDVENRLTAITAGAETIVYINRLTSADYNDGKFYHYFHDAVGNRITQQTHLVNNIYVYDDANRLSQSGVHYTLDLNAGLTQVLSDGTNAYLYGLGRLSENEGGVNEYYLGDALGSVRQLANNNGEITLSKSYEPYGDALQSLGTGVTDYGFTGETTDANGLIYLRARYYSPEQGRFITRDNWEGSYSIPMSYNKWLYVYNNSINNLDPSGFQSTGNSTCSVNDVYCLLPNFDDAVIDIKHFYDSMERAVYIETNLANSIGKLNVFPIPKTFDIFGISLTYEPYYVVNIPKSNSKNSMLFKNISLGIFMNFQYGLEKFESPAALLAFIPAVCGGGNCSGFSNPDLPSDYLGFVSYTYNGMYGYDILNKIVDEHFGGGGIGQNDLPKGIIGSINDSVECSIFNNCSDKNPYNNCWEFKVSTINNDFKYLSWPSGWDYDAEPMGKYWSTGRIY